MFISDVTIRTTCLVSTWQIDTFDTIYIYSIHYTDPKASYGIVYTVYL